MGTKISKHGMPSKHDRRAILVLKRKRVVSKNPIKRLPMGSASSQQKVW